MKNDTSKSKVWTRPEVRRLGTIKDVANSQGSGSQGAGAKT